MNLVISQALASGLPVISTNHSGITDQVVESVGGFLVQEGDFEALAEKILYLIDSPKKINEISKTARASVLEKYNKEKLLKIQNDLYKRIIGN
jgi:colanic acid/amylovoran biosynthesis glycosyltransferase